MTAAESRPMRWSDGGARLSERQRQAAAAFVAANGGVDAFEMIALSGSYVAGLAHGLSDVDVLVTPHPGTVVETAQRDVDGVMLQFNIVEHEQLERFCALGSAFRATASDRGDLYLPQLERKDLVRLTIAERVHADGNAAAALDRIDPLAVARLLMSTHALVTAQRAEDSLGAIRSGDALIALGSAEVALRQALEVAIAGRGDLYVGDGFLLQRAARCGLLDQELWDLLRGLPAWEATGEVVEAHVRRSLLHAGHLLAQALTYAWDAPLPAIPAFRARGSGPSRSPYYMLVRYADRLAISGPDIGLRISPDMARLWSAADGSAIEDIAARMRGQATSSDADLDAVTAAFTKLAKVGAIELSDLGSHDERG